MLANCTRATFSCASLSLSLSLRLVNFCHRWQSNLHHSILCHIRCLPPLLVFLGDNKLRRPLTVAKSPYTLNCPSAHLSVLSLSLSLSLFQVAVHFSCPLGIAPFITYAYPGSHSARQNHRAMLPVSCHRQMSVTHRKRQKDLQQCVSDSLHIAIQ